jgi:hypothetical protein
MIKLTKRQAADYIKEGAILLRCDTCKGHNTKYIQLKADVLFCSCGGILTKSWSSLCNEH